MPIRADQKYDGKVREGSYFSYSANGNLAFHIMLECEDGNTSFSLWLTEKNREKANKTLALLGADISKLSEQNYLDYELAGAITGKEVSFGTREEEYQGNTSIKVAWIGRRTDPNITRGAANFFGKRPQEPSKKELIDDDIPF